MFKKVYIFTTETFEQDEEFKDILLILQSHYKIKYEIKYYTDDFDEEHQDKNIMLYLGDNEIKYFIKKHMHKNIFIGILPTLTNKNIQASYGISSDIHEALDDCLNAKRLSKVDLLLSNTEPTFTNITIGDVHELNNSHIEELSLMKRLQKIFNHIKNLSFQDFQITTANEQNVKTAASGIMVFEHNSKQGNYNIFNEDLSIHDGLLNAFILAPKSILSYIYYLFVVFSYHRFSLKRLPRSIGVIKSSKITIESSKEINFTIDGTLLCTQKLELEIIRDALTIYIGREINLKEKEQQNEIDKESIKIQHLPKEELRNILLEKKIPFFKKASEDDFKELFQSLKENARFTSVFITLMILSTLLATTGLFQSSAPVIIGAMILAPLMAPIISLAMGVVRVDQYLVGNSSKTLLYGVIVSLIFSCIYAYLMPLNTITNEIQSRLNPNILDLMVAVISGIVGAYAHAKSEIAKSLAGVAIAVALVPPLSVTGIGIGWGDLDMIYGSFLLFITNLVGITLAAAITFIILGYAPITRAKVGLFYTSTILLIITIPLVISFERLVDENKILHTIHPKYIINEKTIHVKVLKLDFNKDIPSIYLETTSTQFINKNDLKILQKRIAKKLHKNVALKVNTKILIE